MKFAVLLLLVGSWIPRAASAKAITLTGEELAWFVGEQVNAYQTVGDFVNQGYFSRMMRVDFQIFMKKHNSAKLKMPRAKVAGNVATLISAGGSRLNIRFAMNKKLHVFVEGVQIHTRNRTPEQIYDSISHILNRKSAFRFHSALNLVAEWVLPPAHAESYISLAVASAASVMKAVSQVNACHVASFLPYCWFKANEDMVLQARNQKLFTSFACEGHRLYKVTGHKAGYWDKARDLLLTTDAHEEVTGYREFDQHRAVQCVYQVKGKWITEAVGPSCSAKKGAALDILIRRLAMCCQDIACRKNAAAVNVISAHASGQEAIQ